MSGLRSSLCGLKGSRRIVTIHGRDQEQPARSHRPAARGALPGLRLPVPRFAAGLRMAESVVTSEGAVPG